MNYFVPSLLVLPLLVSCTVVEVDHYGSSYYTHSHPQVEVDTRYVSREARMHGHQTMRDSRAQYPTNASNVHGHHEANRHANARPTPAPQAQSRSNTQSHNEEERNAPRNTAHVTVHGHGN